MGTLSYTVRRATLSDVPVLARHRTAMFTDIGLIDEGGASAFFEACARYFSTAIPDGGFVAWVAASDEHANEIVAGVGLQIRSIVPIPDLADGRTIIACGPEAFIVNMYVERSARRRGLARELIQHALRWAREQGIHPIRLRASQEGRPLYEQLGFRATNDMRL